MRREKGWRENKIRRPYQVVHQSQVTQNQMNGSKVWMSKSPLKLNLPPKSSNPEAKTPSSPAQTTKEKWKMPRSPTPAFKGEASQTMMTPPASGGTSNQREMMMTRVDSREMGRREEVATGIKTEVKRSKVTEEALATSEIRTEEEESD